LAVLDSDIETVLSLLSVNVSVKSRVKDGQQRTALHLAVEVGSEMIVRNLVSQFRFVFNQNSHKLVSKFNLCLL
jgi:hypothetical protein